MPLIAPSPGQTEKGFVNACVLDPKMREEFPRIGQRVAICHEIFGRKDDSTESVAKKQDLSRLDNAGLQEIKDKFPGRKVDRSFNFTIDSKQEDAFKRTNQGFLIANANFTRSGNFIYGDTVEWRPPEEVFAQESMDSLKLVPVTDEHPSDFVDSKNVRDLQKGTIGQDINQVDNFLNGTILITDHKMIEFIDKKRDLGLPVELSCGYTTTVYDIQGESEEGKYDAIQADIDYNHVAVTSRGRAGRDVKLLDSEKENLKKGDRKNMPVIKRDAVKTKSFSMDRVSFEVEDSSHSHVSHAFDKLDESVGVINSLEEQNTTLDTEKSELQGKVDQLTSDNEKLKKDNEELSDPHSKVNQDALAVIKILEDAAGKLGVPLTVKDGDIEKPKTLKGLKLDIITKADFSGVGVPEDKKDDESYISGRIDTILRALASKKANDFLKDLAGVGAATKTDADETAADDDNPREKYIKTGRDSWKKKAEK